MIKELPNRSMATPIIVGGPVNISELTKSSCYNRYPQLLSLEWCRIGLSRLSTLESQK